AFSFTSAWLTVVSRVEMALPNYDARVNFGLPGSWATSSREKCSDDFRSVTRALACYFLEPGFLPRVVVRPGVFEELVRRHRRAEPLHPEHLQQPARSVVV